MINALELRVGNIVNDHWTYVTGVHINGDVTLKRSAEHPQGETEYTINADQLKPVLISEEILLRMHFQKNTHQMFYYKDIPGKNTIAIKLEELTKVYLYKMDYGHRTSIVVLDEMPVHFFQNLYFMLAGIDCPLLPVAADNEQENNNF